MNNIEDFLNKNMTGLIIGSYPDEISYEKHEFYAHPEDLFWTYVYMAFQEELKQQTYAEKMAFLKKHHLGICYAGEFGDEPIDDAEIGQEFMKRTRCFQPIWYRYPKLQCLFFNGYEAYQTFTLRNKKLMLGKEVYFLPTSDKNNHLKTPEEKIEMWCEFLKMTPQ